PDTGRGGLDQGMSASNSGIGMTSERTRMRMIEALRREGIRDERVLAAMTEIPRHAFVDEGIASRAYEDTPLPRPWADHLEPHDRRAHDAAPSREGPDEQG